MYLIPGYVSVLWGSCLWGVNSRGCVSVQCWHCGTPTTSPMLLPQLGDVFALGKTPPSGSWNSVIVLDLDDPQAPSNPNHPVQAGREVCQAGVCVPQISSAGFKMKCFHLL